MGNFTADGTCVLPPHSNFTRDNLLLCGADMMKHSKIGRARVLASAYGAYEE